MPAERPATDEEHRAEERNHWRRLIRVAFWLNWITLAGVAVGSGGLIVLYFTLQITAGQLQLSKDSEQRQLRAYAYVTMGEIAFKASQTGMYADAAVKTIGLTPAYDMNASIAFALTGAATRDLDTYNGAARSQPIKRVILFPSQSVPLRTGYDMFTPTDAHFGDVKGGVLRLLTWGRIDYRDAFGCKHWLTYCFDTHGDTLVDPSNSAECDQHNDTDNPAVCSR
jgi:hypothetical protein